MLTSTALDLGAGLQVLCSRHRSSYVDQDSMGDWFFAVKFFLYVARLDAGRAAQALEVYLARLFRYRTNYDLHVPPAARDAFHRAPPTYEIAEATAVGLCSLRYSINDPDVPPGAVDMARVFPIATALEPRPRLDSGGTVGWGGGCSGAGRAGMEDTRRLVCLLHALNMAMYSRGGSGMSAEARAHGVRNLILTLLTARPGRVSGAERPWEGQGLLTGGASQGRLTTVEALRVVVGQTANRLFVFDQHDATLQDTPKEWVPAAAGAGFVPYHGLGASALQMELRKKGIDRALIETAVAEVDELAAATQAAHAKARRWHSLPKLEFRKKLAGFLQRRGFSYDIVREVTEALWEELNGDASEADNHF